MDELAILERAGLALVRVTDEINWLASAFGKETPFQAAGKSCAATTANLAVFDLGDDGLGFHPERLRQRAVAAGADVFVDRTRVAGLAHVGEQHAFFQRMRRERFRQGLLVEFAGDLDAIDDCLGFIRRQILEQLVVDHHHGPGAAGREALDCGNRELSVGGVYVEPDAELLLQSSENAAAAAEFAGERPADFDVKLAARLGSEHRVECHHFPNVDRLQAKLRRGPFDLFPAKLAGVFLQQMQQPQHRCAFVLRRVVRDDLVDMTLELGWDN